MNKFFILFFSTFYLIIRKLFTLYLLLFLYNYISYLQDIVSCHNSKSYFSNNNLPIIFIKKEIGYYSYFFSSINILPVTDGLYPLYAFLPFFNFLSSILVSSNLSFIA